MTISPCYPCRHCIGTDTPGQWLCQRHKSPAVKVCKAFEVEPGADPETYIEEHGE